MSGPHSTAIAESIRARPSIADWFGVVTLLAWLAYLLAAPTIGFNWIESWHNEQRAAQIVLLVATAAAFCLQVFKQNGNAITAPRAIPPLALAFFAIGAVSASRSEFVLAAFAEVGLATLLLILALLTAAIVSNDVQRYSRLARWFALLLATAYVLGVMTRYAAAVELGRGIDFDVLILGYANPRFPSALHALLIPFIACIAVDSKEPRFLRAASIVVLTFIWAINFGLQTRAIWFAYLLVLPFSLLLFGWRNVWRMALVIVITAMAGVVTFYAVSFVSPPTSAEAVAVASLKDWSGLTSRDVLWQMSWDAMSKAPLLGIGPMQFAALENRVGAHPHNWAMQIASEWGVPALLLVLFALLRVARTVRKAAAADRAVLAPTLAVGIGLANGLVDGNLAMPVSQCAFVLAVGLMLAMMSDTTKAATHANTFTSRFASIGAALLATVAVVAFASLSFPNQAIGVSRFQQKQPGAWLVPRFWEQGLLF